MGHQIIVFVIVCGEIEKAPLFRGLDHYKDITQFASEGIADPLHRVGAHHFVGVHAEAVNGVFMDAGQVRESLLCKASRLQQMLQIADNHPATTSMGDYINPGAKYPENHCSGDTSSKARPGTGAKHLWERTKKKSPGYSSERPGVSYFSTQKFCLSHAASIACWIRKWSTMPSRSPSISKLLWALSTKSTRISPKGRSDSSCLIAFS